MTSDTLHGSRSPIPRKSVKYASRDAGEGMLENGTQIIGERDIVLIDPQSSLSGAHKLAAELRANVLKQYPGSDGVHAERSSCHLLPGSTCSRQVGCSAPSTKPGVTPGCQT